jgi:hypothetical protein
MGEQCFRGSYPESSTESLRQKAIAAIKELTAWNMVIKQPQYRDNGSASSNLYILTDYSDWFTTPTAKPELSRKKGTFNGNRFTKKERGGSERLPGGVVVNDYQGSSDSLPGVVVNDYQGSSDSLPHIKEIHIEGNPISKEIQCMESDTHKKADVFVEEIFEQPAEVDNVYPFVDKEIKDSTQEPKSGSESTSAAPRDNKTGKVKLLVSAKRIDELEDLLDSGASLGYTTEDELKALADRVMGSIVAKYRKSSLILCSSPNDIDPGFLKHYALTKWKDSGKIDAAFNTVRSFERDATKWQGLCIAVQQWEEWLKNEDVAKADFIRQGLSKNASSADSAIAIKLMAQQAAQNASKFKTPVSLTNFTKQANIPITPLTPPVAAPDPQEVNIERKPLDPTKLKPEIQAILKRAKSKAEEVATKEA